MVVDKQWGMQVSQARKILKDDAEIGLPHGWARDRVTRRYTNYVISAMARAMPDSRGKGQSVKASSIQPLIQVQLLN
jgi:hypothetical protein